MKDIRELEPCVSLIELDGKKIYLIGTAHVSRESADLVRRYILEQRPATVCLELCEPRLQSLRNPDRWKDTDIVQIIRSGRAYVLLAQLILSAIQRRLASKLGVKAGEEMLAAMEAAEQIGSPIVTVDRDIKVTLKRAWRRTSVWSLGRLAVSAFGSPTIDETEIEALKSSDMLSSFMEEFAEYLPGAKEVLIDERDEYMAANIQRAPGQTVVAVVGAGHSAGILRHLGATLDITRLDIVPPPSLLSRAFAWSIPLLIVAMFIYGFVGIGGRTSWEMIAVWIVACGSLAAIGAMASLAHPLTVLTAFVAAPVTTLHPALAVGWICGLVEALLKRPRVRDLETIAEDIQTVRGFWRNRLSRILLVMLFTNLGGAIGLFVGSYKIAALLT